MLTRLFSALSLLIYIQISPERLTVKNIHTGTVVSETPELAISTAAKSRVLGVGTQARSAAAGLAARIVNPFAHPRSMVSDFTSAEQLLKAFVLKVAKYSSVILAPTIIIHPLGSPEGGYTQVELRAFREMGIGAGASRVLVWTGRALTDQEAQTKKVPPDAGVWN